MNSPRVVATRDELVAELERATGVRAVVPTMGALHDGHAQFTRRIQRLVHSWHKGVDAHRGGLAPVEIQSTNSKHVSHLISTNSRH